MNNSEVWLVNCDLTPPKKASLSVWRTNRWSVVSCVKSEQPTSEKSHNYHIKNLFILCKYSQRFSLDSKDLLKWKNLCQSSSKAILHTCCKQKFVYLLHISYFWAGEQPMKRPGLQLLVQSDGFSDWCGDQTVVISLNDRPSCSRVGHVFLSDYSSFCLIQHLHVVDMENN